MSIIETDRLILRNWREDDRQAFFEMNADRQVEQTGAVTKAFVNRVPRLASASTFGVAMAFSP